jgi:hypothetical protein
MLALVVERPWSQKDLSTSSCLRFFEDCEGRATGSSTKASLSMLCFLLSYITLSFEKFTIRNLLVYVLVPVSSTSKS